jgi:hypothetical protein
MKMKLAGYEIRQGKHLAFRAPEQKNFTYMKSLGSYYTEENVQLRLEKNRHRAKTPRNLTREIRLYIDISTYVVTGNREGFEHWAQLNNLKQAALTFNYLSENNLLNYDDFRQHIANTTKAVETSEKEINEQSEKLSRQKVIKKHCDTYRHCHEIVEGEKSASDKKAYQTEHQDEYQLHNMLKQHLRDMGLEKIPTAEEQQADIDFLEDALSSARGELANLKKQKATLDVVRENFENLLMTSAPELEEKKRKDRGAEESL